MTIGPAISDGFYYDFYSASGQVVKGDEYGELEKAAKKIVKQNVTFDRLHVSKEQALDMFEGN